MSKIKSFLFTNTSAKQTIAKNTFWLSISHIAGRLIKVVLLIYAARVLGTSGYGVFSYALSLGVLFSIFANPGINGIVTRNISASGKIDKSFLATSTVIKLSLVFLSALAVIFIAPFFTKLSGVLVLLPIIAILIIFDGIRNFVLAVNRAREKMEIEAGIQILTTTSIVIAGLIALVFFETSKTLLVAYAIGSSIGLLATLLILGKNFSGIWNSFKQKLVIPIFRDAWPFALLGLLGVIMINTDIIMLGLFRGAEEVGLYSAAHKSIQVMYAIPEIIAVALLPAITKLVYKDDKKVKTILEQTIATTLLLGVPLTLGGIVVGRELIHFLYGAAYIEATLTFQLLLATLLIVFPSMIIANAVFAYNKQRSFIGFLVMGVIGNIFLNMMLIPKYGIAGSAVATIGAAFVANAFVWRRMKKINHFKVLPYLRKIIPAAIVMTGFTIFMQIIGVNLIINILISALIYFVTLKLLREDLLTKLSSIVRSSA